MKKHADYALTGVIASLMLFASVQLGFNSDANAGEEELSVFVVEFPDCSGGE